jgi:hypothetical protein
MPMLEPVPSLLEVPFQAVFAQAAGKKTLNSVVNAENCFIYLYRRAVPQASGVLHRRDSSHGYLHLPAA